MWLDALLCGLPLKYTGISQKKAAKYQNQTEFQNMFFNYYNMAMDIFHWKNLPDTCDERTLERSFLLSGKAMIAEYGGCLISPMCAWGAGLNLYGRPLELWGYGANGFNQRFNAYVPGADKGRTLTKVADGHTVGAPNAVTGRDNSEMYPYISYIYAAAARLSDLFRSCDVLVKNLKSPFIVSTDEPQKRTIEDLLRTRDENVPLVLVSQALTGIKPEVLSIQIPPETLKLFWTHFRNVEGQLLETLGIESNANADKLSGVSNLEVQANNGATAANLAKRLEWRQRFAEDVNAFFGLNIEPYVSKIDWDTEGVICDVESDGASDTDGMEGGES